MTINTHKTITKRHERITKRSKMNTKMQKGQKETQNDLEENCLLQSGCLVPV